ncbi:hypothetical protein [Streptomyces sp. A1547]|uniref:hypothetical protein n=1 Tax=Streptomyces sp. A1547 TaxID=2563105 RepID=UPI00109E8840|nr:hypothetical protein [Streptomyces sp. A1547]THA33739.1 hypothetical protein E6W17_31100 [Streptomyces sp. A1547]
MPDTDLTTEAAMKWWSLYVEMAVPSFAPDIHEEVMRRLARHHAATTTGHDERFAIQLTVNADSLAAAVAAATTDISDALEAATGRHADPVRIEAMTEEEFDAEQEAAARAAAVPELMGRQEIADLLGVTPQRVNAIARTAAWRAAVVPVQTLRNGALYLADQVRDFAASWTRAPGRPSKNA